MSECKEKKPSLDAERAQELKDAIITLASVMSVSGFEHRATESVKQLYGRFFDEICADSVGNLLLIKRCGKENAVRIMIDTHLDEIGFVVSEVLEGGFLRIANIGGIDRAIMQASDVAVYGREVLRGVIISTPPHLRGESEELPEIEALLVDVGLGYSKEELEKIAPVGTPVGFAAEYGELLYDRIFGKSFDNKACAAIAAMAIAATPKDAIAGDVYLSLSCREETARQGGAFVLANRIRPDYAMAIDVNLANAPDVSERDSVKMGEGISVSISSATDRALTRRTVSLFEEKGIAFCKKAEPSSTGTNAVAINLAALGVPVVDVGLPLRNMHTYNEIISLDDTQTLYDAVREFITSGEIAEEFAKEVLDI